MIEVLPGEDKMHKILKANNIVLMRSKSAFGIQFNVLHHPAKTQIYTKLGTFTIKPTSDMDIPTTVLNETDKVLSTIPDFPPLKR